MCRNTIYAKFEGRLAKEAARIAAGHKVVRNNAECRSSSSFASERSAQGEKAGKRRRAEKCGDSRYEKVEDDGRTNAKCSELDIGISFVKRAET